MLIEIFLTFFKIGAFTFGGGYAMIPIIKDEIVVKKKWLKEDEFLDAIAVSQGSPGSLAVNTSIYVGYKIGGFKGGLVASLGTVLPSFLIILFIAINFYKYRDNPLLDRVFQGIRPAIVSLILAAVYQLIKMSNFKRPELLVSLGALFLVVVFKVSPIYLIITASLLSVLANKHKNNKSD